MNSNGIDSKMAEEYLAQLQKCLEEGKPLEGEERSLGRRYLETTQQLAQQDHELEQMQRNIDQAVARRNSMVTRRDHLAGRVTAFAESLIALRFEREPPKAPSIEEAPPPPAN